MRVQAGRFYSLSVQRKSETRVFKNMDTLIDCDAAPILFFIFKILPKYYLDITSSISQSKMRYIH